MLAVEHVERGCRHRGTQLDQHRPEVQLGSEGRGAARHRASAARPPRAGLTPGLADPTLRDYSRNMSLRVVIGGQPVRRPRADRPARDAGPRRTRCGWRSCPGCRARARDRDRALRARRRLPLGDQLAPAPPRRRSAWSATATPADLRDRRAQALLGGGRAGLPVRVPRRRGGTRGEPGAQPRHVRAVRRPPPALDGRGRAAPRARLAPRGRAVQHPGPRSPPRSSRDVERARSSRCWRRTSPATAATVPADARDVRLMRYVLPEAGTTARRATDDRPPGARCSASRGSARSSSAHTVSQLGDRVSEHRVPADRGARARRDARPGVGAHRAGVAAQPGLGLLRGLDRPAGAQEADPGRRRPGPGGPAGDGAARVRVRRRDPGAAVRRGAADRRRARRCSTRRTRRSSCCSCGRPDYIAANSALSASRSVSFIAGPALGGALVQWLTAPVALLVDAVSFVVVRGLPRPDPARCADRSAGRRGRRAGQAAARRPRRAAVHAAAPGAAGRARLLHARRTTSRSSAPPRWCIVYASRELRLSSGLIGLALGVGAVGGLVGAVTAPWLSRRIGVGATVVLGGIVFPASIARGHAGRRPGAGCGPACSGSPSSSAVWA